MQSRLQTFVISMTGTELSCWCSGHAPQSWGHPFAVFVWYLFRRLKAARAVGRALQSLRDPLATRVRPLAWGLTAALVSTLAANIFYLTMSFYYFFVFALLVVVTPTVFAARLRQL